MIVNIRLDVSDPDRREITLALTGKAGEATRKQVTAFVEKAVEKALRPGNGKTIVKTYACPKCGRPIALHVPAPPASTPVPTGLAEATKAAALALSALAASIEESLKSSPRGSIIGNDNV